MFITSCQNDDGSTTGETTHKHYGVTERRITLQDLKAIPEAMRIINKINGVQENPNRKSVYNEEYDFFINTDEILRIDNGDFHSLTFPVFRYEDNGLTENLVLSEQSDGSYKAFLYGYDLTAQEKNDIKDGKPSLISKHIKREPINFDSSTVTQRLIPIWYTEVVVIPCGSGEHNATNFGQWHTCKVPKKAQVMVITRVTYVDDGDSGWIEGGNYSSGSGSSGGGNGTWNPNIPPFDPDKDDLQALEGNITKPVVVTTNEQLFYNNDLSGENEDLRFVMNDEDIREPLLEYLSQNGYSEDSRDLAVEILSEIWEGNIDEELAIEIIEQAINNETYYFDGDSDNTEYTGPKRRIPSEIILSDGNTVSVEFGTTADGVSADQEVANAVVAALIAGLNHAHANLPANQKITSIYISATTNGVHSPTSNHSRGTAVDISRINGVKIANLGANNQVTLLQEGFDTYHKIRENFGPHFKHKTSSDGTVNNNWPIGGHQDHIHISVQNN